MGGRPQKQSVRRGGQHPNWRSRWGIKRCPCYAERPNLSVRMHCRRYTRLTNAHSKTFKHHAAMTAIFVAWYNFCRTNSALGKKTTPAMAAGLADGVWTIKELLERAASDHGTASTIIASPPA